METYYVPKAGRALNRIVEVIEEKPTHITCRLVGRTTGEPIKRKVFSTIAPESLTGHYEPMTFVSKADAMATLGLSGSEFGQLVTQAKPYKVDGLYCLTQIRRFVDRQAQATILATPSGISLEKRIEQMEDLLLSLTEKVDKGTVGITAKLESLLRLSFKQEFPDSERVGEVVE